MKLSVVFIIFCSILFSCNQATDKIDKELWLEGDGEAFSFQLYKINTKVNAQGVAQCSKYYFHKTSDTNLHIYGASLARLMAGLIDTVKEERVKMNPADSLEKVYVELVVNKKNTWQPSDKDSLGHLVLDFLNLQLGVQKHLEPIYQVKIDRPDKIVSHRSESNEPSIRYKGGIFYFKAVKCSALETINVHSNFIIEDETQDTARYDFKIDRWSSPDAFSKSIAAYGLSLQQARDSIAYFYLQTK